MLRSLLTLLLLAAFAAHASAETTYRKVLFLGNSITMHGPKADIDWSGNWGMAATAEARDYVHLVTHGLTQRSGVAPEILVKNIVEFERGYASYDAATGLKEPLAFGADLIILAIGENVRAPQTAEERAAFQHAVTQLLTVLKAGGHPTLLVRSCFWASPAKDEPLRQACAAVGGTFVDLGALGKDEHNYARSERPYKHDGVANHPGDQGMAAIATAILQALPK
jgi:alpha-galactosidase